MVTGLPSPIALSNRSSLCLDTRRVDTRLCRDHIDPTAAVVDTVGCGQGDHVIAAERGQEGLRRIV